MRPWTGEGFHTNRPKTVARSPHHTTESYVCFKIVRVGYRYCKINEQLAELTPSR
jgi:hypothetical protein